MPSTWEYQYLEDEKLHYITELHPEDGILGEHFFEYNQVGDLIEFCIQNNLYFDNLDLPFFGKADTEEYFIGKYKLTDIEFNCRVRMFEEDKEGTLYKTQYKLTLDMLEDLPPESLGIILKRLYEQLKNYINEQGKLEKRKG